MPFGGHIPTHVRGRNRIDPYNIVRCSTAICTGDLYAISSALCPQAEGGMGDEKVTSNFDSLLLERRGNSNVTENRRRNKRHSDFV